MLQYDNINIWREWNAKIRGLDDFVWGVSKTDKDYVR